MNSAVRVQSSAKFSLLEVMVALALLVVAIFGTLVALGTSSQLRQTSRTSQKAMQLLEDRVERFRAVGSGNVVATLTQAVPNDQIGAYVLAANGTEGNFTIAGLVGGGATELKGASVTTLILDEAQTTATFATPDLDGDGVPGEPEDSYDLDGDLAHGEVGLVSTGGDSDEAQYRIVPLRITISYQGARGELTLTREALTMIYPTVSQ